MLRVELRGRPVDEGQDASTQKLTWPEVEAGHATRRMQNWSCGATKLAAKLNGDSAADAGRWATAQRLDGVEGPLIGTNLGGTGGIPGLRRHYE